MDIKFNGKRALVTGAGKGIGRGIALKLAECGAKVVAVSRTQADLDSLKQESPSIEVHSIDLTDWDVARKAIEDIGPIDLLVNNAGTAIPKPFLEVTKDFLHGLFDINFMAVYNITQVVAKGMIERGNGGSIVMMSSMLASRALERGSVYCTSKAALDQLTRSLALELGPHKIRVNNVNPTVTLTPMTRRNGWEDPAKASRITNVTPLGRLADIEDVVNATLFLLSEKSSMMTGASIPVDGGITIHVTGDMMYIMHGLSHEHPNRVEIRDTVHTMKFRLTGGIGRATALKLAECGAKVVAISRTQADLDSLKQESPGIETHVVDLSDWDVARKAVEDIGPIDLLVNNAGTNIPEPFAEVKKETLQKLFDINFMAVYNITQVVAKGMIERGNGGSIVMMSSTLGIRAMEIRSVYCCTKAAIDQLTRSLALELGPHKIRVNSVNPTVTLTPLAVQLGWENPAKASRITGVTPLGRLATVEDVVNATLFLLSEKSPMITGAIMPIDGGLTIHV